jgi:hypothetical protein
MPWDLHKHNNNAYLFLTIANLHSNKMTQMTQNTQNEQYEQY